MKFERLVKIKTPVEKNFRQELFFYLKFKNFLLGIKHKSIARAESGRNGSFNDDLTGHRPLSVHDNSAMTAFAQIFIGGVTNFFDGEISVADLQLVTDDDIGFEFGNRVLYDHISEIRAKIFVHQNKTLVAVQERARVFSNSCEPNLVFDFH